MTLSKRHIAMVLVLLASCGENESPSPVQPPGSPTTTRTDALEAGATLLQRKEPLDALNTYLDGFHFYNGSMEQQMEAHHYCSLLNEDVTQCVIYDGNGSDAKIMGVEYIVSGKVFETLPPNEKHLWHSHVYEVRSGQLIAPGIPETAEKVLMAKIAGTYGKTWHTWHTDQDHALPLGTPMLMMGFTQDGQAHAQRVEARDQRLGIASADRRESRADLEYPQIDSDADAWQKGIVVQLQAVRKDRKGNGRKGNDEFNPPQPVPLPADGQ
jgi:hypothetical protein